MFKLSYKGDFFFFFFKARLNQVWLFCSRQGSLNWFDIKTSWLQPLARITECLVFCLNEWRKRFYYLTTWTIIYLLHCQFMSDFPLINNRTELLALSWQLYACARSVGGCTILLLDVVCGSSHPVLSYSHWYYCEALHKHRGTHRWLKRGQDP